MLKRKRNRLPGFDYSSFNYYFTTICVHNRQSVLGKFLGRSVVLNEYGIIVEKILLSIPKRYQYVELDEFAIMPNHVHAIIIIDPSKKLIIPNDEYLNHDQFIGTSHDLSLQPPYLKIKSLSELVGAFKTISSKEIHQAGFKDFKWQRSFYDHIIRNEKSLYQIRQYIQQNPFKLEIEKNQIENLDI